MTREEGGVVANRLKGEVDIQVGAKTYTLCMDINALAWLEERYSTPEQEVSFPQLLDRMEKSKRITDIRTMMCAALQKHHPGITIEEAGDVMQATGGLTSFASQLHQKIRDLRKSTVPDPKDLEALTAGPNGNSANPPIAQTRKRPGRGARSSSTRAASV